MHNNHTLLPHQSPIPFLTDGGLETTLVFHKKLELPCFAAFPLLKDPAGRELLRDYYHTYARLALRYGVGFVLESTGWRGNPDWAEKLGYSPKELEEANRDGIRLMHEVLGAHETAASPMIVSGAVGPRGDGYRMGATMSPDEAASYHAPQIRTYRDAGADLVSAFTLTYAGEALGIANAAADLGIPSVISFTLETNGRLPSGQSLDEAIGLVDAQATNAPAYYMINCAHPTHFASKLPMGAAWLERIVGLRANASCRSHAELDESPDLDAGDPAELGRQYRYLRRILPRLNVLGGCCGTDDRHLEAICEHCLEPTAKAA
jgi:S-methylmethionine-dependent homocysteine/selenocysteine methylase